MSMQATPAEIRPSEITPKAVWLRRRELLAGAAAAGLRRLDGRARPGPLRWRRPRARYPPTSRRPRSRTSPATTISTSSAPTRAIPTATPAKLTTHPWTVKVDGLVAKPADYQLEDILKPVTLEERIYRLRCVEAWSMVIPWVGFPLADLLKRVEPQGSAKYVAFETLVRPDEMPGQRGLFQALDWPYVEGLRLDEAMHPLTILAVGLYGETLAQPERRPDPARGALEVRLQEHQVDRPDQPRRGRAADHLEQAEPWRVRVLFERQPGGRPSALEPGDRAPDRPGRPVRQAPPDPAVQWLRRSGRQPVQPAWTCGSTTEMAAARPPRSRRALVPAAPARAPSTSSASSRRSGPSILASMDQLGADPMKVLERDLGLWALKFLVVGLAITPLRRLTGISLLRYRRAIGLLAFIYAACT